MKGWSWFCLICLTLLVNRLFNSLFGDSFWPGLFGSWQLEVMLGLLAPVLLVSACTFEVNGLDCQKLQRLHVDLWKLVSLARLFLGEFKLLLVELFVSGGARRRFWLFCMREGETGAEVGEGVVAVLPT